MIQPQKLHIGNYVEYLGEIKPIISVDGESEHTFKEYRGMVTIPLYDSLGSIRDTINIWCAKINPIPITHEILERLGFVQNLTHKRYWHIEKFRYNTTKMFLDIDTGHRNGEGIGWMCVKIENLHQLQNLYYALTNKELTFKTNITCTTHESK